MFLECDFRFGGGIDEHEERPPCAIAGLFCQLRERPMRTKYIAWWLVVLSSANAVANGRSHLTSLHGRIVAFRPAERIGQVVSGAVNRETFLLAIDGKAREIVKLIDEHDGYSELSNSTNDHVILEVRRDRSCDGSYGQFILESPVMTSEDKSSAVPPLTRLGSFTGLPPSYQLKCYRLNRGNIHMDMKNP